MKKREPFQLLLFDKALVSFRNGLDWDGAEEWKINVVVHRFMLAFHQGVGAMYHYVPAFRQPKDMSVDSHVAMVIAEGWIKDPELWVEMRDNRNIAAHPYLEDESAEIYGRCPLYYEELLYFYNKINKIVLL
jgi:hypothetical protein